MAKLSELFNVDYFIVSQTNPHIIPFLQGSTRRKRFQNPPEVTAKQAAIGRAVGLGRTVVTTVVSEITHQMQMMSELGIFPLLCAKVRVCRLKAKLV